MASRQVSARDRLFHDLITGYNASLNPEKTELTLGLCPQLVGYNKATGELSVKVWEYHSWKDSRLTWSPADYDGIKSLRVPSKHVWIPDTKLYNSVTGVLERDADVHVLLSYDGLVLWIPVANYRVLGDERSSGEVSGKIKFGCWTYSGHEVALKLFKTEGFDMTYFDPVSRYTIISSTVKVETLQYQDDPYSAAVFNFVVRPRA